MLKAIGFSKYKCFSKGITIEPPTLVNLVIGKNNSGKSSLLDLIKSLYTFERIPGSSLNTTLLLSVEEDELDQFSLQNANWGYQMYADKNERGKILGGAYKVVHSESLKNSQYSVSTTELEQRVSNYRVSSNSGELLFKKHIKSFDKVTKISAERDIVPERKNNEAEVFSNGSGLVASLLYHQLNKKGKRNLIANVLRDLNFILKGEYSFSNLQVLENENEIFEIRLTNIEGQEIPLSEMGSGIKTIIFALYVLNYRKLFDEDSILMFEELENNLHPEIQRRLFNMIYDYAIENNCMVFVTSHSNVAINSMFGKENVTIYHVCKEDEITSKIEVVKTNNSKRDLLDDIGVKASDIFQSNGIIWVEGPSDRVYLNKWINLVEPTLKENIHYSFLYYGGRLLSHYSGEAELKDKDYIDILLTNRNSAIIMDSDIKNDGETINDTKERIKNEFTKSNSFCWITKGREIENYIHKDVINNQFKDKERPQIGDLEDFKDYIKDADRSFESHKVQIARILSFSKESLEVLDLKERLNELVQTIKSWNLY